MGQLKRSHGDWKDLYLVLEDVKGSLRGYVVRAKEIQEEFEWLLTDDDQLDSEINSWVVLESEVQEIYTQVRKYPEDAGKKMELTKDAEAISNAGPLSNPFQPKWNLATFDGNVLKFAAFWDQYEAGVHPQADFKDVTKLVYLHCALLSNALKTVEGFSVTNANYSAVVDALKLRFSRRTAIIERHVESFLGLGRGDTCVGTADL
ncbi:hypothetical protein M513_12492 [Trichuris suis]|uniref:Uncharacterized protein n=1 Tax=Trichuris suis TaxID=68888 RepID=A0A085LNU1_9BILA|nr:hypothetical protein M513_12492 [Trichuris suis]